MQLAFVGKGRSRPAGLALLIAGLSLPAAAAAQPAARVNVPVTGGNGVAEFHLILQELCERPPRWRGPSVGCAGSLESTRSYGPKPVNAAYPLQFGKRYYLVPVCGTRVAWESRMLAMASRPPRAMRLQCVRP